MPCETIPVVFRLPKERLARLQSIARKRAAAEDRPYTVSDLVREALEGAYPEEDRKEKAGAKGRTTAGPV
ncbi:MAG: hypothetical protein M5U26_11850 [Planctomycetota bacterium]|nr:hypothetical protein [Planctomycetota bacterium]